MVRPAAGVVDDPQGAGARLDGARAAHALVRPAARQRRQLADDPASAAPAPAGAGTPAVRSASRPAHARGDPDAADPDRGVVGSGPDTEEAVERHGPARRRAAGAGGAAGGPG